jgi:hypothetical protein
MWRCAAKADVRSSDASGKSAPAAGCPTERPYAGTGCSLEGQRCDYHGTVCFAPTIVFGPTLECRNGTWSTSIELETVHCPAIEACRH